MSFFFRPPPLIRQVPVAVAVLFSAPQVDNPPAERLHAQAQWHAAFRPVVFLSRSMLALQPALYPTTLADEPIPSAGDIQARTRAAYAPAWPSVPRWFPLATPHIPSFDDPTPSQRNAHQAFRAAYRPALASPGHGVFDPALFPAVQVDSPPTADLGAQQAALAAARLPWTRPSFRTLDPALFQVATPDNPPLQAYMDPQQLAAVGRRTFVPPFSQFKIPIDALDLYTQDGPIGLADTQELSHLARATRPAHPIQAPAPVAILFGAPIPDSPLLFLDAAGAARAAMREPFKRSVTDNSFPAPLFLTAAGDLPALAPQNAQQAAWAAYRIPWARQAFQAVPAALIAASTPDSPPIADLGAQQAFQAASRPPWVRPAFRTLDLALMPVIQVDSPPTLALDAQGMFFAGLRLPWRRPPFQTVPAALFTIDAPPPADLGASQAFLAAIRPPWYRPRFRILDPALLPAIQVDSPPIGGLFAQEAYKAAFRAPWVRSPFWTLSPALIPSVIVDAPPISDLRAQQQWWTAFRRPLVDYLRSIPHVHDSFLAVVESGDHAAIMLRLTAIDATLAALQASVNTNHVLISNLQTGLNILILASSAGSTDSSTQYADIIEKLNEVIKKQKTMLSDQSNALMEQQKVNKKKGA